MQYSHCKLLLINACYSGTKHKLYHKMCGRDVKKMFLFVLKTKNNKIQFTLLLNLMKNKTKN